MQREASTESAGPTRDTRSFRKQTRAKTAVFEWRSGAVAATAPNNAGTCAEPCNVMPLRL